MSIPMTYVGPTRGTTAGDWTGTFFPGQSVVADPATDREAASVVDAVVYDGSATAVTLRDLDAAAAGR